MKTLTVKNPWALLIALGVKDIENRTWKTNYRGRIFIHASSKEAIGLFRELLPKKYWDSLFGDQKDWLKKTSSETVSEIIGSVEIVDCVQNHESIWAENNKGVPEDGEIIKPIWNWVLKNPRLELDYKGLKVRGAQSLWEFTEDRIIKGKENV